MPLPAATSPLQDEEQIRKRKAASDAAYMDMAIGGRASTNVAGNQIALSKQMERARGKS